MCCAAAALRRARPRRRPGPFRTKLPIPRVVAEPDFRLPIVEAEIGILPGPKTRMWTYGGDFPGPTIRRPSGQPTRARFTHRLPKEAGELTVHLHGGHNRASEDGQPGGLTKRQPRSLYCDISPRLAPAESGNDLLIRPGASRTYEYDFTENGNPERATMLWYHDHRLDRTGAQRLERPRRDVDPRRRRRRRAAPPSRPPRDPAADRRPLVRPPQPADQPLRRPRAQRRRHRALRPRQRSSPPLPPGRGLPASAASAQRVELPHLQPGDERGRHVHPDRHRGRADARAPGPSRGRDRAGRASRSDRRLQRRRRRDVELRSVRRPGAPNQRGAKTWNGLADAVQGRQARSPIRPRSRPSSARCPTGSPRPPGSLSTTGGSRSGPGSRRPG